MEGDPKEEPPRKVELDSMERSFESLETKTSTLPPKVSLNAPDVVGKLEESVQPVTKTLSDESRNMEKA